MIIGDSVASDRWRCRGPAWLFVPADRPDRIRRAAELADHAVIDLEDGVDPVDRPVARSGLVAAVHGLARDRLIVRISPPGTPDAAADLAAVRAAGLDTVMIAKAEDPELIGGPELAALRVIPLCESSRAVLRVDLLAEAPAVVAVMWGSVDLAADLGCAAEAPVLQHVRWQVLLATRAARRVAVDHALPDLDDDAVTADALTAAQAGFDAKACLHPRHLPLIRAAFAPDPATLAWAEQVLATAQGSGAQRTAGGFIDHAVIARARKIIARRAHPSTRSPS